MPKFFSNDPSKTLEELQKSPQFAFECLQALVARLLERGELNREQANEYVGKQTTWDSKRGLKRSWKGDPVAGGSGSSSSPPADKQTHKPSKAEKGKH